MRGKIIKLTMLSGGCPEQWTGKLKTGEEVFVRERHGETRIEINDIIIIEKMGSALDVLYEVFDIECDF